jgi:hypothetical protein
MDQKLIAKLMGGKMEKHNPIERKVTDWTGKQRITWCGPFAVATVAGTEYEPAYQRLKTIRGKRHCKGVTNDNIAKACKKMGIIGKWTTLDKKRKLSKFVPEILEQGKVYIIQITRHVLVMDTRDWTTIDNQVPEWRAMDASHHWSKKLVNAFYEVENPKFDSQCDDQLTFDFELAS